MLSHGHMQNVIWRPGRGPAHAGSWPKANPHPGNRDEPHPSLPDWPGRPGQA